MYHATILFVERLHVLMFSRVSHLECSLSESNDLVFYAQFLVLSLIPTFE